MVHPDTARMHATEGHRPLLPKLDSYGGHLWTSRLLGSTPKGKPINAYDMVGRYWPPLPVTVEPANPDRPGGPWIVVIRGEQLGGTHARKTDAQSLAQAAAERLAPTATNAEPTLAEILPALAALGWQIPLTTDGPVLDNTPATKEARREMFTAFGWIQ